MATDNDIELRLPLDLANPDGPYTIGKATVLATRGRAGIATLDDQFEIVNEPDWADPCGDVYFEHRDSTESPCAIRPAIETDYQQLRVPVWIQDQETPSCCNTAMSYVGHIDDPQLCREPPAGALMWWHDEVRFYIFTCSKCLSVSAVGQQC